MHELAVTESILNIATDYALKAGASRVTASNCRKDTGTSIWVSRKK